MKGKFEETGSGSGKETSRGDEKKKHDEPRKSIPKIDNLDNYNDFLNDVLRCQYCKFTATTKEALGKHRMTHSRRKLHKCEQCDYECHYRGDLVRHKAKHSEERNYKCPHCDFATKWRRNVRHHLLKHTEERPYTCKICDFKFKRLHDLKYHMYRHNDEKPIKCDECDFCCKTNYELKCHKLKHSDVRKFSCTYPGCMQQTKTKSDLTKHLKTHTGERNHICPICDKGFTTVGCLNKHIQRHDERKLFSCELCRKHFKTKASLKNHLKLHQGIKPFVCNVCEKTFSNKYNMMKHQETHSEDRPFKCPICPYGARSTEHLLAHIGSMHGNSYAYFCELCKKPFRRYGQLRIHLKRMHRNENLHSFSDTQDLLSKIKIEKIDSIKDSLSADSTKSAVHSASLDFSNLNSSRNSNSDHINKAAESLTGVKIEKSGESECSITEKDSEISSRVPKVEPDKISDESSETGPPATLAMFDDGFRLPLATKGFQFNFHKKGKKPRSWFMDPQNMSEDAAERQLAYLSRKAHENVRGKHKRKAQRRRRKLLTQGREDYSYHLIGSEAEDNVFQANSQNLLSNANTKLEVKTSALKKSERGNLKNHSSLQIPSGFGNVHKKKVNVQKRKARKKKSCERKVKLKKKKHVKVTLRTNDCIVPSASNLSHIAVIKIKQEPNQLMESNSENLTYNMDFVSESIKQEPVECAGDSFQIATISCPLIKQECMADDFHKSEQPRETVGISVKKELEEEAYTGAGGVMQTADVTGVEEEGDIPRLKNTMSEDMLTGSLPAGCCETAVEKGQGYQFHGSISEDRVCMTASYCSTAESILEFKNPVLLPTDLQNSKLSQSKLLSSHSSSVDHVRSKPDCHVVQPLSAEAKAIYDYEMQQEESIGNTRRYPHVESSFSMMPNFRNNKFDHHGLQQVKPAFSTCAASKDAQLPKHLHLQVKQEPPAGDERLKSNSISRDISQFVVVQNCHCQCDSWLLRKQI